MRRALIIIGVTVLLVGAATTALALNSTEESANTVAALQTQDDTTTPTTTEEAPARPCPAFLEGFRGQGGMGRGGIGLAELLGMEPAELRQAIAEGKTVPELAEERGIDLVAAHIAAAEERIATAEAEGRITAEQAAEMREHVQERAEAMANGEGFAGPKDRLRGFRGQGGMGRGGIGLAELLGMEPAELRQAIAEGKTVPELAEERGIDLVAAHIAAAEERIATAEAEGRITAEQAAEMREHVQERAEAMANGEGFGQGGFRGHDRGRGFGFGAPDADGANAEGASIST